MRSERISRRGGGGGGGGGGLSPLLFVVLSTILEVNCLAATSQEFRTPLGPFQRAPAPPRLPETARRPALWPPIGYRASLLGDRVPEMESPMEERTAAGNVGGIWPEGLNRGEEELAAVAAAEYMGTRAVAYAGAFKHHRQHHRQPRHHGDNYFSQRYQQPLAAPVPSGRAAAGIYTKFHPGRRVCTRQAPTSLSHHHRGRQIRLVYTEFPAGFSCCPGWTQVTRFSYGCNKPSCGAACLNGGSCIAPGKCVCPKQFVGKQCQIDVDECVTEKPCAQLCQNTFGGYKCSCRIGYQLQSDEQSCRKNDSDGTAFEAHDLETDYRPTITKTPITPQDSDNEVGDGSFDTDYEIILKRLTKLEKLVARSKRRDAGATEMSAKINLAVENIGEVKKAVESMRLMKQEVNDVRIKLSHFEQESRKVQHIANRLTDLESRFKIHCRSMNGNGRAVC